MRFFRKVEPAVIRIGFLDILNLITVVAALWALTAQIRSNEMVAEQLEILNRKAVLVPIPIGSPLESVGNSVPNFMLGFAFKNVGDTNPGFWEFNFLTCHPFSVGKHSSEFNLANGSSVNYWMRSDLPVLYGQDLFYIQKDAVGFLSIRLIQEKIRWKGIDITPLGLAFVYGDNAVTTRNLIYFDHERGVPETIEFEIKDKKLFISGMSNEVVGKIIKECYLDMEVVEDEESPTDT